LVRLKVIAVGRTKEPWIKAGILHYQKLLRAYADLKLVDVREETLNRSQERKTLLESEAERILGSVGNSGLCIALEVGGESLGSEDFARLLSAKLNQGYNDFTFILGGTLGLSQRILDACPMRLSLSRMTFTHEMSRVILLEQIYRAFSILKGTKYHK
jgi:23S rRNA (pseudouridine1915-N3)-methyltransferase